LRCTRMFAERKKWTATSAQLHIIVCQINARSIYKAGSTCSANLAASYAVHHADMKMPSEVVRDFRFMMDSDLNGSRQ